MVNLPAYYNKLTPRLAKYVSHKTAKVQLIIFTTKLKGWDKKSIINRGKAQQPCQYAIWGFCYSREELVKRNIAKYYSNKVVKEFGAHISQAPVSGLIMAKDRNKHAVELDLIVPQFWRSEIK